VNGVNACVALPLSKTALGVVVRTTSKLPKKVGAAMQSVQGSCVETAYSIVAVFPVSWQSERQLPTPRVKLV